MIFPQVVGKDTRLRIFFHLGLHLVKQWQKKKLPFKASCHYYFQFTAMDFTLFSIIINRWGLNNFLVEVRRGRFTIEIIMTADIKQKRVKNDKLIAFNSSHEFTWLKLQKISKKGIYYWWFVRAIYVVYEQFKLVGHLFGRWRGAVHIHVSSYAEIFLMCRDHSCVDLSYIMYMWRLGPTSSTEIYQTSHQSEILYYFDIFSVDCNHLGYECWKNPD